MMEMYSDGEQQCYRNAVVEFRGKRYCQDHGEALERQHGIEARMDGPSVEFYRGFICALAVIEAYRHDTLYDDAVQAVGGIELCSIARQDGSLKWSGLARWKRRINRGTK